MRSSRLGHLPARAAAITSISSSKMNSMAGCFAEAFSGGFIDNSLKVVD